MGGGNVPRDHVFLALVNHGKHAIVRRHKILVFGGHQQGPPLRAHSRIDDHDMNRARRKIGIRGADGQGRVQQIVRRDVVRDIDDGRFRIDF